LDQPLAPSKQWDSQKLRYLRKQQSRRLGGPVLALVPYARHKSSPGSTAVGNPGLTGHKEYVRSAEGSCAAFAERLEKCICFCRSARCAPLGPPPQQQHRVAGDPGACGSKEWHYFKSPRRYRSGYRPSYPRFRDPANCEYPRSPCSLHPGLSYAVPMALCWTTQITQSLPLRVLTALPRVARSRQPQQRGSTDSLDPGLSCAVPTALCIGCRRALWQRVVATRVIHVGGRWIRRGCPGRIAEIEELRHVYLRCISFCERR
jgi:hypothetical protein